MVLPVLLDCGPSHNDAIAVVLVLTSPEPNTKAITPSARNQTPGKTLHNVLRMLTLLNRTDIPVTSGVVKPLMCNLIIVGNVHGESGLGGLALPEPTFTPQNCTAVGLMAKALRESEESVTIVSTGPQASITLLFNNHPELHSKIARIMIMGGTIGLGNWVPATESSTYVDSEAAEIVLQSRIPVATANLGVTRKAQIHVENTKHSRVIGNLILTIVAELLDFFLEYHKDEKWDFVDAPLHDPCTIAWPLKPELFTTVEHQAGVEIQGKYIQSMTVIDYYYLTNNKPDAAIMVDIDR